MTAEGSIVLGGGMGEGARNGMARSEALLVLFLAKTVMAGSEIATFFYMRKLQ